MSEKFRATNGARIELEQMNPRNWKARFDGSKMWFYSFKTKFEGILWASHKMRKSAKSLDWTKE